MERSLLEIGRTHGYLHCSELATSFKELVNEGGMQPFSAHLSQIEVAYILGERAADLSVSISSLTLDVLGRFTTQLIGFPWRVVWASVGGRLFLS